MQHHHAPCLHGVQVSNKIRSVHPVYAAILNRPYLERYNHPDTVAQLTVLTAEHWPAGMSDQNWSQLKLHVFHASWECLCMPVVCSIVGDNPELSMIAGTFMSHNCAAKCQRCLRPANMMGSWNDEPAR